MSERPLPSLVEACEAAFDEHGDTFRGVGGPRARRTPTSATG